MSRIVVNESYAAQRVTGQQRYATEIAARLCAEDGVDLLRPSGFWARSTTRVWLWVQLVLPLVAGRRMMLSLTARAPLWRRRHVLVVHDLFVLTNPEWYTRRYIWTHAPLLRAQLRSADAVVAVSAPVAEQVERLRSDPVAVAPNAPSDVFSTTAVPTGPDDEALVTRGLRSGDYLLAVGNRDPRKNMARLAQSYAALTDSERRRIPLVVVGGAAAIYRSEEIDWPAGTVDAGYIDDDDLRVLYRHARSVILLSRAEGFGLPIVEAAAAGARGLLLSDIEVFRWICADQARYVDPTSTTAITAALRAEIDDPQDVELDLARFDWDTSAAVVSDVCRRVASTRRS